MFTLLLTDMEGPGRAWEAHPQAMAGALANGHRGLLINSRGEGDATFSVFRCATAAAMAVCSQATAGVIADTRPAGGTLTGCGAQALRRSGICRGLKTSCRCAGRAWSARSWQPVPR